MFSHRLMRTDPNEELMLVRAIGITRPGGPDVLTIIDRPSIHPGANEVRITVAAAAVNPADIGMRTGGGRDLPAPWTPGMDAAGTVSAVGDGVSRLSAGDEVMAVVNPFTQQGGAQAAEIVVPAASVVKVPDGVTLQQAATLPMNGLTAKLGLELLNLAPGTTLAVTGGAGQLASYVIPLAKLLGLRVVADARPADADLVHELGADEVLTRSDDFPAAVRAVAPDGADGVYDTAKLHELAFGALRDGGRLLAVDGWDPDVTERGITVKQEFVFQAFERTDWLEELRQLASDGRLRLRDAHEFPPEEVARAHELMEAGGLRGRAVIVF